MDINRNDEICRIRSVYSSRDSAGKRKLYAWHRSDIRQQDAERERVVASLLIRTIGADLSNACVLDVGCGTGKFLRTLVEWGATPEKLVGTEFLPDRLEIARRRSASSIRWHQGGVDHFESASFDLVTAHTVFSSILDLKERRRLAEEMWRALKPKGWVMVFDFRYNNPANLDVLKVMRKELRGYWPNASNEHYRTLLLAPPIARKLIPISILGGDILSIMLPFLRSHFIFMVQKPRDRCDA